MKRRFFIMILALLALFTCSCEQKQQRPERPTYEKITSSELTGGEVETGTIPGDYIYRAIHVGNKGLLLKYHIPTGTATTVCQDPFCDHDAVTCPFSIGPSQMSAIGNMLYYVVRSEDDEQMHLRSYNGDDMKIEELRASDGVIGNLFAYNYYLYFFEKLPTNVQEEFKTTVYRLDTQSGALDIIDCGHPSAKIYSVEDNMIIWKEGNKYLSTDLDGDDTGVYTFNYGRQWGGYRYRWEVDENEDITIFTQTIYRQDPVTKEEIVIAEHIGPSYFYGDKILYFMYEENPRVWAVMDGLDYTDRFGGNVYIMNMDGSDNRLLCHVDDCVIGMTSTSRNNEYNCGDWVGIDVENIYLRPNGPELTEEYTSTDMLIVNVVTGEYKHIKYNPYE